MKKKSTPSMKRYQPIYILRDGKPIHMTTRYRTPALAKRKYCEQNEIGGADALVLSAQYKET